jgi:hypothetical protein
MVTGLMSPYVFKLCIARMLSKIADTCFLGSSDASYIAYADDILFINRRKFSLSKVVDNLRKGFLDI